MTLELSTDQLNSIKRSYLNILGLFITDDKIESRFLRCLLKWGFQLNLNADDLRDAKIDVTDLQFRHPDDKIEKLEAIYHTVEKGDWLSKIAKKHYGDANKYMLIFEANKPMLSDPDKIYPGQVLRIPAL